MLGSDLKDNVYGVLWIIYTLSYSTTLEQMMGQMMSRKEWNVIFVAVPGELRARDQKKSRKRPRRVCTHKKIPSWKEKLSHTLRN